MPFQFHLGCVETWLNCLSLLVLRVKEGCVYMQFSTPFFRKYHTLMFCNSEFSFSYAKFRFRTSIISLKYCCLISKFSCMRSKFVSLNENSLKYRSINQDSLLEISMTHGFCGNNSQILTNFVSFCTVLFNKW